MTRKLTRLSHFLLLFLSLSACMETTGKTGTPAFEIEAWSVERATFNVSLHGFAEGGNEPFGQLDIALAVAPSTIAVDSRIQPDPRHEKYLPAEWRTYHSRFEPTNGGLVEVSAPHATVLPADEHAWMPSLWLAGGGQPPVLWHAFVAPLGPQWALLGHDPPRTWAGWDLEWIRTADGWNIVAETPCSNVFGTSGAIKWITLQRISHEILGEPVELMLVSHAPLSLVLGNPTPSWQRADAFLWKVNRTTEKVTFTESTLEPLADVWAPPGPVESFPGESPVVFQIAPPRGEISAADVLRIVHDGWEIPGPDDAEALTYLGNHAPTAPAEELRFKWGYTIFDESTLTRLTTYHVSAVTGRVFFVDHVGNLSYGF